MKKQFSKTPLFKSVPNYAPKKPVKMSALESFELTADETREVEGGFVSFNVGDAFSAQNRKL